MYAYKYVSGLEKYTLMEGIVKEVQPCIYSSIPVNNIARYFNIGVGVHSEEILCLKDLLLLLLSGSVI